MTPKQIKEFSTKELITIYSNKIRCYHSEGKAESVMREIKRRIGNDANALSTAGWHCQNGEGDADLNHETSILISRL